VTALHPRRAFAGYSDQPQPLESYAVIATGGTAALALTVYAAARRGTLPERLAVVDVVAVGLATHKIARLLTKDSVTAFIRAPFVRLDKKQGTNTLEEHARGDGFQRAIGELVSCPECTGQWVAGGLLAGSLHLPRATRAITALYSALTIADLLQYVYTGLKSRA
jgi:hypothetical protein